MDLGLNGKIAIVTGGSDGLGKAAAMRLAAEGAKVAIASRDQGRIDSTIAEIKTATGSENLIGISTDVTDESQVISMADAVVAKWGGIDILVNNAGTSAAGKFEDIAIDTWKYDIQLKVYAAHGILVNTVCVGVLKSGQTERIFEAQRANDPALTLDGFYSRIGAGVPMGRVGESEEVGDVIAFLASDRASYVTGAAINIDGGQSPVV